MDDPIETLRKQISDEIYHFKTLRRQWGAIRIVCDWGAPILAFAVTILVMRLPESKTWITVLGGSVVTLLTAIQSIFKPASIWAICASWEREFKAFSGSMSLEILKIKDQYSGNFAQEKTALLDYSLGKNPILKELIRKAHTGKELPT